jgi:general secretion pathway protein J
MIASTATDQLDRQTGFTLMELLVAVVLLALLSVILTGSLRFGFRAWARGADHAERVDQIVLVQDFLRRTIADVYPFFLISDPTRGGGHVDFAGTAQHLGFLAAAPIALGGRGRARFELSVVKDARHSDFVVTSIPELADSTVAPSRKILMSDVEAIEISYFGKLRSDKSAAWHEAWVEEAALPQLVRIRVRLSAGATRSWPDLVIAPRMTADVGCVHDPLTKQCRGR